MREENFNIVLNMYESRHIFLHSEIDIDVATKIEAMLFDLNLKNNEPIHLHIFSGGGEIYSGLSIIDTMQGINSPVYTYTTGLCASMAAIIFAAGDKRFMGRNTRYMIHQPLGGMQGKASDIQTSLEEMMNLKTITSEILSSNSKGKISVEQILEMIQKDCFLSADKCLEYGFCDEIINKGDKNE